MPGILPLDAKGNPLCYKCGKVGYSFDCLNHPPRKIFSLGVEEEPLGPLNNVDEEAKGEELQEEIPEALGDDVDKEEDHFV